MNKLLQKAKSKKLKRRCNCYNDDIMELAVAWAKDEIQTSQVSKAIGKKRLDGSTYSALSVGLKMAVQKKLLK